MSIIGSFRGIRAMPMLFKEASGTVQIHFLGTFATPAGTSVVSGDSILGRDVVSELPIEVVVRLHFAIGGSDPLALGLHFAPSAKHKDNSFSSCTLLEAVLAEPLHSLSHCRQGIEAPIQRGQSHHSGNTSLPHLREHHPLVHIHQVVRDILLGTGAVLPFDVPVRLGEEHSLSLGHCVPSGLHHAIIRAILHGVNHGQRVHSQPQA